MDLIYLFQGENNYLIKEKINNLLKDLGSNEFNTIEYDMEESTVNELIEEAKTFPFLEEKKIIVVRNAYALLKSKDMLDVINYLDNPQDKTILIFDGFNLVLEASNALAKTFKLKARIEVVKEYENMNDYITRQLEKNNIQITNDALEELISRTNNKEMLHNEIEKLCLYAMDNKVITKDDVCKLVSKNLEENIFEITNAILSKNKSLVMKIYRDLINNSEDDIRILNIITNKFLEIQETKLLLDKKMTKEEIANYFNVSSGRAYYMIKNASDVSINQVNKCLMDLGELDYKIKSGKIDKRIGLELFLLGV